MVAVLFLRILADRVEGKNPELANKLRAGADQTSAAKGSCRLHEQQQTACTKEQWKEEGCGAGGKSEGGGNCVLHKQKQTACTLEQRKEEGCGAGGKSEGGGNGGPFLPSFL